MLGLSMSEQSPESTDLAYAVVPAVLLFAAAGMFMAQRRFAAQKSAAAELPRVGSLSDVHPDGSKRDTSYADKKLAVLWPLQMKEQVQASTQLVFNHLPKTAGTNLSFLMNALSQVYPDKYKAIRYRAPRMPGKSAIQIDNDWRGSLEHARDDLKANTKRAETLNFICGHFPFGIHSQLKAGVKYVTLVRDPIERELSFVNFCFQRGLIGNHAEASDMLLNAEIDNPQTRVLAGELYMNGVCDDNTFQRAIRNLKEHFALVGVSEDTNTFIQVLASIQGWGPIAMCKAQVTGEKIIKELPALDSRRKSLNEKHAYDLKLYSYAREEWINWKAKHIANNQSTPENYASAKILCITSSYAADSKPRIMTFHEIEEYNRSVGEGLVKLQQSSSGKPISSAPSSPRVGIGKVSP